MQKQWSLAKAFCAGQSRREGARLAGVEEHSAGRNYARFEKAISDHALTLTGKGLHLIDASSPKVVAAVQRIESQSNPRRRRRGVAGLFLASMKFEDRLGMLYLTVFKPRIRKLQISAFVAQMHAHLPETHGFGHWEKGSGRTPRATSTSSGPLTT